MASRIIVSDPVPSQTLDLGPGFGTGLGLDNCINDHIVQKGLFCHSFD